MKPYEYKIILKSGASFEIKTDNDFYECYIDEIEDYLDLDKTEYSLCHFCVPMLNKKPVAFINKGEISAIIFLGIEVEQ